MQASAEMQNTACQMQNQFHRRRPLRESEVVAEISDERELDSPLGAGSSVAAPYLQ